nr:hypothetical protein [Tanacetum cinerariifolium]
MTINELTVLCTSLSKKVKSLESDLKQIKLAYSAAYTKLIMNVKKLENKVKSPKARRRVRLIVSEDEDGLEDPSKQGRKIAQIDEDKGITLVQMGAQSQGRNEHEVDSDFDFTTAKDIKVDRAQKEKQKQEEATIALLTEEFDEIQARMDADHELAARLTYEEQEQFTIEEKEKLLAEFFERRKKQLAAERSEAIRNKPHTRTQVRNMMITYLKHMGKYTHQQLKHKSLEELHKLYQKEQKWIDDFKPMDDNSRQQVEISNKRQREVSDEESSKKQKLEEDNDAKKRS